MIKTKFYFEKGAFAAFLSEQKYSQVILLADAKTNGFCLHILKRMFPVLENAWFIVIPDGEQNKNLAACQLIWDGLIALNADKNTLLLNTGGGMLCDTGAFAASVYKRGIDFVNIPTTLLAMADAGHGGKTGINQQDIKNVIGTFQHPVAVYTDPIFLQTLSERNLKSGIAEIVKHALLQSKESFHRMVQFEPDAFYTAAVIHESVLFKSSIVSRDEYDEEVRQTLNFGHTIGHALESHSMNTADPLLHGEAVMLGMICEAMISHMIFALPIEIVEALIGFKQRIFPLLRFDFTYEDVAVYLHHDKKHDANIRMSLLLKEGECRWQVPVSPEQVKAGVEAVAGMA